MKRITLITLGLSIAACTASSPSSSTTSPATAADYEDTAQTIASATVTGGNGGIGFGDVLVFGDAVSIARGHLPPETGAPCAFCAAAGGAKWARTRRNRVERSHRLLRPAPLPDLSISLVI